MMASVSLFGGFAALFFWLIGLAILYFVITIAVRHGIDSSETGRKIREQMMRKNMDVSKQHENNE